MGQGAIDYIGVKGGLDINGIIESYYVYAGENISAGDFVEFINGISSVNDIQNPSGSFGFSTSYIYQTNALLLDTNKVIVCWIYGSGKACIVNFSEDFSTVTIGTELVWESSGAEPFELSACKISNSKVFITYERRASYYDVYCNVLTIDGNTITASTKKLLADYQVSNTSCKYFPYNDRVVIGLCQYGTDGYGAFAVTATITGTSISFGTFTTIQTGTSSIYPQSVLISPTTNNYFIFSYSYNGTYKAYRSYINGTNIVASTSILFSDTAISSGYVNIKKLSETQYLWSYINNQVFYGTIIKDDGNPPSNTIYELYALGYSSSYYVEKIDENNCCLVINIKNSDGNRKVYGGIIKINGTVVSISQVLNTNLDCSSYTTGILLDPTKLVAINIYVQYSKMGIGNMTLSDKLSTYETQVRKATKVPCNGVAKTSGVGGDETGHDGRVSVYVPLVIDNCEELLRNLTWTETTVGTKYVANDGTIISADSYNDTYDNYATYAFDNDTSTYFRTLNGTEHYLQIQFVEPIKVAFMQIMLGFSYNEKLLVQASNNGSVWTDLHDFGTGKIEHTELVTLDLTHVSESYSYYRIYTKSTQHSNGRVYEWKLWR